jgi:hypothetical protein
MFVAIYHEIHDQAEFKQKVNAMAPPPRPTGQPGALSTVRPTASA